MDQHDILRGRWFWNWLTLIRVLLHQLLTFRLQLLLTYIKGSHSHHHQSSGAGTGALGGQMTPGNLLRGQTYFDPPDFFSHGNHFGPDLPSLFKLY